MELSGARILVVGATGALGGQLARALHQAGAAVAVTGRGGERLSAVAADCGIEPVSLDVLDLTQCQEAVTRAALLLGGLDGLIVATGVAAFGRAMDADPAVVEELFAVNTLGPMALVRAAAPHLTASEGGGFVVVLSAILADLPTAGMAEYSASKSAVSAWLSVVRRENRRDFRVIDVRPPHLDTGLDQRALAGEPPRLPAPHAGVTVVDAILEAIAGRGTDITWDASAKRLAVT